MFGKVNYQITSLSSTPSFLNPLLYPYYYSFPSSCGLFFLRSLSTASNYTSIELSAEAWLASQGPHP